MFEYIYKVYSYTRLLYNIRYVSNHNIDIDNDDNWIDVFVENIENCGSMAIKCVQWVLPRYQLTHSNSKLAKKFEKFYKNCYEHDLSHTKRIYYNNFDEILLDNYEIIEIIGSGSIGQVYKIRHIKTDKIYALKVSHPNLNIDFYIFNLYFKLVLKYFDYKQYVPIDNINYFILATHHNDDDKIALEAIRKGITYVGVIASQKKSDIIKKYLSDISALSITTGHFILLIIPVFILLVFSGFFTSVSFTPEIKTSFMYLIILSIVGTGLAKIMFNQLIQMSSPVFSTSVAYLIPIVAIIWGFIDGEKVSYLQLLAGVIILTGIYIVNKVK